MGHKLMVLFGHREGDTPDRDPPRVRYEVSQLNPGASEAKNEKYYYDTVVGLWRRKADGESVCRSLSLGMSHISVIRAGMT